MVSSVGRGMGVLDMDRRPIPRRRGGFVGFLSTLVSMGFNDYLLNRKSI